MTCEHHCEKDGAPVRCATCPHDEPNDVAVHAVMSLERSAEARGHRRGLAEGAAAERARLVAVVRSHYVALFPGGDHRLDMFLLAMGGGEEGSGA